MTWPAPCSRSTGSAALVTLTTPKRLVSICARKSSSGDVLDGGEVGIAGVVDDDVETAEGVDRQRTAAAGGVVVGDVERERADAVAELGDQVVELFGRRAVASEPMAGRNAARVMDLPRPRELPVTRKTRRHAGAFRCF